MSVIFLGFLLLITGGSSKPQSHGHLNWSEFSQIPSPNGLWELETHPVFTSTSNENKTPVSLRKNGVSDVWPLFLLARDADVYWNPDGTKLLVVNEPLSGTNELLLFSVKAVSTDKEEQPADKIDEVVKQPLLQQIGRHRNIDFYLPQFVKWKGNDIVLAVGGTTDKGIGPMKSYCYGVVINSNTLRVQSILSGKDLNKKFGAKCQLFP